MPLFHLGRQAIHDTFAVGSEGEDPVMENAIGNWRNAVVGLGLTIVVVGGALAVAFL